ncbi:hypothetical protein F5Y04DRAFT_81768 [Hypomontagnella monticulosa]|nr:hypothetical protein F5Y04DRAFT_81768 [Hypomontagnella monticulosa]
MEALAAIGLASNVLQFVDLGYKLLLASKEMYSAGNGASHSNQGLDFMATEMKRLTRNLNKGVPMRQVTDEEEALLKLAHECQRWSTDILALLDRLRNRNPNSKFEAFKAAVRNLKAKDERDRLEKGLDDCRKQLDIQLTSMFRSEALERFEGLVASAKSTNEDLAILKDSVNSLHRSMPGQIGNIGTQFLERLEDILRMSAEASLKHKQELFLGALRYQGMEDRFYNVDRAHAATFEWLLDGSHNSGHQSGWCIDRDKTATFRGEARERFTDWLQHGHGIFHICGKPGAGKSTLMKFLCKNQLTRQYLENWADDQTLVFCKSFFWTQGSEAQKSFSGLIRSLLYQVLSTAPDLIPIAFPSRWAQCEPNLNVGVQFELDEIEHAFDDLLVSQATFEKHKLVFFIDGLDEYHGRHTELVNKFFNWTKLNTGNLKICVSSREWNEFMVGFAECPKLRIHECTLRDITIVSNDRLEGCSNLATLIHDGDIYSLVKNIAEKAEGVFQWVNLVLTAVEGGILNGDSASDLNTKVHIFPTELGALYQHLFDSIHAADRPKAFETLRMARHMEHRLPLLRVWFLNKVIDDPDYAIKMKLEYAPEEEQATLLKITRRQIYGRCKGLLEVFPPKRPQPFLQDDGIVGFMHNTVHEFLDQAHIQERINQTVGHSDLFDRVCQTFLACAKFANQEWFYHGSDPASTDFNIELNRIIGFAVDDLHMFPDDPKGHQRRLRFFEFLNGIETVASTKLRPKLRNAYRINGFAFPRLTTPRPTGFTSCIDSYTHVQAFAISNLLHEFLREKDSTFLVSTTVRTQPVAADDTTNDLVLLLVGTTSEILPKRIDYSRLCKMLELCFSRGISPNYVSPLLRGRTLFTILLYIVMFNLSGCELRYNYEVIPKETCIFPLRLFELNVVYLYALSLV